jgi:DNA invertase Pin-like site-specific DNA recombinase
MTDQNHMNKKIGYGRMPESWEEFGEQRDALLIANCDLKNLYLERDDRLIKTGKQLKRCLASINNGDTLVVLRLDRLTHSFLKLAQIFAMLRERDVKIEVLDPPMIFDTSQMGAIRFDMLKQYVNFLGTVSIDKVKAKETQKYKRKFRRKMGRDSSLSAVQIAEIIEKRKSKSLTITFLATEYKVCRNTIYKALNQTA